MKRILVVIFFFYPFVLFSQALKVNVQGQKQAGMAYAGSALVLDETSIFYSPGAMSMSEQNGVTASLSTLRFQSAFNKRYSSAIERVESSYSVPFSLYAMWGLKNARWKVGIGAYSPFNSNFNWGNLWSGKYIFISSKLHTTFIQPTLSYRLSERFGIGAGLVYAYSRLNIQRALPFSLADGSDAFEQLDGSGEGFGWNGGFYYSIPAILSISLVHHSKVLSKFIDQNASFVVPSSLSSEFPATNSFSTELPLPSSTTLGIGFDANEKISVAVDFSFINWKKYDRLNLAYGENSSLLYSRNLERNFRNSGSVKVGVQHRTTDVLTLRAGTAYLMSPIKDDYINPDYPDANRFVLSLGVGYEIGLNWEINASFLYEDFQSRTQNNEEVGFAGTYKTHMYAPGISVGYKW